MGTKSGAVFLWSLKRKQAVLSEDERAGTGKVWGAEEKDEMEGGKGTRGEGGGGDRGDGSSGLIETVKHIFSTSS